MPDMHVTVVVGPTAPTVPGDAITSWEKTVGQTLQDKILAGLDKLYDREEGEGDFPFFIRTFFNQHGLYLSIKGQKAAAHAALDHTDPFK